MKHLLLLTYFLFLTGCTEDNFPKVYLLENLRLLGVQIDTPEINDPGSDISVNVTPILADYNGSGRAVTIQIIGCIDPGISGGADPNCDSQINKQTLVSSSVVPFAGGSGHFDSPNYIGPTGSAFNVIIPTGALIQRSPFDQHNGVPYLLDITLTAGEEIVKGFKRIIISNKTVNTNPATPSLKVNGVAPSTLPTQKSTLSVSTVGTTSENYVYFDPTGNQTISESVTLAYFISGGTLNFDKTDLNQSVQWSPPSSVPAGQNAVVVVLVRDNRGGLSYSVTDF